MGSISLTIRKTLTWNVSSCYYSGSRILYFCICSIMNYSIHYKKIDSFCDSLTQLILINNGNNNVVAIICHTGKPLDIPNQEQLVLLFVALRTCFSHGNHSHIVRLCIRVPDLNKQTEFGKSTDLFLYKVGVQAAL